MTGLYEWNPMPYRLEIKCPECQSRAFFEFAEIVKISLTKDIDFFKNSSQFDYQLFKDHCGHGWHGAVFYPGLHGGSTASITELPEGYSSSNWNHSRYLSEHRDIRWGSFVCTNCSARKKHDLKWPEDAFYSMNHKGNNLWAFDRESAVELRDFIGSTARDESSYKWSRFLRHIPTVFKHQKNREPIVKQINKLLAC